jgi:hypothetical protein
LSTQNEPCRSSKMDPLAHAQSCIDHQKETNLRLSDAGSATGYESS